jgi:hypothetical protein
MNYAVNRKTVAKKNGKWAKYDTWKQSVRDYILWQRYYKVDTITVKERYYTFLANYYTGYVHPEKDYVWKLKKIKL